MWLLWEVGAMAILLPELSSYLDDDEATEGGAELFFRRLDAIDRLTRAEGPLDDVVLWASILFEPLAEAVAGARDVVGAAHDFLDPIVARIAMPRRITDGVARISAVLPRLKQGRMGRLVRSELVVPALDVLEIDCIARGVSVDHVHAMRQEVTSAHGSARGGPGRAPGFYRGASRAPRRG
jgi:poly(A) polymerase